MVGNREFIRDKTINNIHVTIRKRNCIIWISILRMYLHMCVFLCLYQLIKVIDVYKQPRM